MSELTIAPSLDHAFSAHGEIRAGGTDVQDRRRNQISSGDLIDISRIAELRHITRDADGSTRIGALTSLATIAQHAQLIADYPGFAMAVGALATPQIRTMASLGGSLLQQTRCWYFRNPNFDCFKKGGNSCPAREGDHRYGVCIDLGPCAFPHASTPGMMLLAYDAEVEINGREWRPVAALYGDGSDPRRDHTLGAGEILTAVRLPAAAANERAAYFRAISRARAEWPLVEAGVRLLMEGETITGAAVVVGGVANIPLRLPEVEAALIGNAASPALFEAAAAKAAERASPLPQTGYKVALLSGTLFETLRRAYERIWGGEG